jgi:hypothetical protein
VRQVVPLLEQLTPIYLDIATGTQEFSPPPEESRSIIRQGAARPSGGGRRGAALQELGCSVGALCCGGACQAVSVRSRRLARDSG